MARIRSIKPEFWQDEKLARLPLFARMLFIGLWNVADDAGRLRGNTLFIRAQVFPYDAKVDVEEGLALLAAGGFIQRYEADAQSFIWVCKFSEHQRINRPSPSFLPPPPESAGGLTEDSLRTHGALTEDSLQERKGKEQGAGRGKEQGSEPAGAGGEASDLKAMWDELANPSLARWDEVTAARKKSAKARVATRPLSEWPAVIAKLNATPFLLGENDRGWRADLDWLLRPDSVTKLLEGKYDRSAAKTGPPKRPGARVGAEEVDWSQAKNEVSNEI